jgi:serine/threonine-protein kinase
LTVEGRPQLGIGLLESAERVYTKIPRHGRDLPRLRMSLGDAYDRVGRDEDARRELESALDGQLGQASPSGEDVLAARERWGRFLLAHGELAGAEVQLRETLGQARGRSLVQIALAQGDIARLDIARHDESAAARDAQLAVDQFEHVQGFWDVRSGPYLWCIYAQALLLAGDPGNAQLWAQKALAASVQYDAPESASIREARALVAAAAASKPSD